MSEVNTRWQQFFDCPEGITFGVHRIRLFSSTSDHLKVPRNLEDVQLFSDTLGASVPTFYQYAVSSVNGGDRVAIDGGTVGQDLWCITKHRGVTNQGENTP